MSGFLTYKQIRFGAVLLLLFGFFLALASTALAQESQSQHADGTLILSPDGKTVFLIERNELFAFRDVAEFYSHGYTFDQVQAPLADDFNRPFGKIKRAATWSLITKKNDPAVYLVRESDVIRLIPSMEKFNVWGYKTEKIITVQSLEGYKIGNVLE